MSFSVSLPMYPQPGAKAAWEGIWGHIGAQLRARGLPAPRSLQWPQDLAAAWRAPDLLIGQTCARPYGLWVHRHAEVLGAFDFGLTGCAPGEYRSVILTRRGETRDWRQIFAAGPVAISAYDSQSGFAAWAGVGVGALPDAPLVTGSHAGSVRALAEGRADVALVDAVSWRYLRRSSRPASALAVRGQTPPTPGLPLITAKRHLAPRLRTALERAFATAPDGPMRWLGLRGFVPRSSAEYLPPLRSP